MMKDKNWLKEQIKHEEIDLKYAFDNYVPYEKVLIADDVNELLNQLEEPEIFLWNIAGFIMEYENAGTFTAENLISVIDNEIERYYGDKT